MNVNSLINYTSFEIELHANLGMQSTRKVRTYGIITELYVYVN